MAKIVIALGGNALQPNHNDISVNAQLAAVKSTSGALVDLIEQGHELLLTHGNGPQVGQIVSTYETASAVDKKNPSMPFPECGAMSQGYIGYHLQQALRNEMDRRGIDKQIATIITQVIVDKNDPAFHNPTKPVGSFFTKEQAKDLEATKGYIMKEDANRGYRRVVPSPKPKKIVEEGLIRAVVKSGQLVITTGGGGIPVVKNDKGELEGVAAVIDKDFSACKLADMIDADLLLILTAVDYVSINFGKPDQKDLKELSIADAKKYIAEGQFAAGSMLPKIEAAMSFVEMKQGRRAVIASLGNALAAVRGEKGTVLKN